jgi:hypothetical protein
MLLNYLHEYAILLHLNFSVDRASPLSVKRSGGPGGWEEEAPFQINEATISADDNGPVIKKWW